MVTPHVRRVLNTHTHTQLTYVSLQWRNVCEQSEGRDDRKKCSTSTFSKYQHQVLSPPNYLFLFRVRGLEILVWTVFFQVLACDICSTPIGYVSS